MVVEIIISVILGVVVLSILLVVNNRIRTNRRRQAELLYAAQQARFKRLQWDESRITGQDRRG